MNWLRFTFLLLVLTLLWVSGILDVIAIGNAQIKPNLLLILLVYCCLNCSSYEAIIASFAIGFAADIAQSPIGPYMVSFGVIGSLLAKIRKAFVVTQMPQQAILIFLTGFLIFSLALLLTRIKSGNLSVSITAQLFWTPLYSAAAGPFVFLALSAISKWLGLKKLRYSYRFGR